MKQGERLPKEVVGLKHFDIFKIRMDKALNKLTWIHDLALRTETSFQFCDSESHSNVLIFSLDYPKWR